MANPFKAIGSRLVDFVYNIDRAVASLLGAPPQDTISSEIGKHDSNPVAEAAEDALDKVQRNHVENAVKHASILDAADNGFEG